MDDAKAMRRKLRRGAGGKSAPLAALCSKQGFIMTTVAHTNAPQGSQPSSALSTLLTILAAGVALAALAGSLHLSLGMGLKACPLCFYQRTFVMGAAGVLCLGLLLPGVRRSAVNALALPMAVGGLGVAIWHCYLESTGFLECPRGVFEFGSAPQQSLAAHVLLLVLLIAALLADAARARADVLVGFVAIVVGLL